MPSKHIRLTLTGVVLAGISGVVTAQSNTVPGLDGKLYDITSPTVWGREGAPYPDGQIGFSAANYMCNPGSVTIPWFAAMQENHPMFGFMVTRLTGDRMVQISDRSMCKHAFTSINGSSGPCLPCQNPGTGSVMGVGCYDVYGASNNGSRTWLGPADEIDPWLGTWNHVGSYFDRGDPDVGPPNNNDGLRSTIFVSSPVKNRVTIQESDLVVPNSQFFYQIHLLHRGEAVAKRGDNILSRGVSFAWNGTAWSEANVGSAVNGTVLNRWPGASVTLGGNGADDGRIAVAVKVTGPVDGRWHYEYAVHNIDNSRGAATFRLPICPQARVSNLAFRDIDGNALNQWTASVVGGEVVFSAPSDNALRWNMLFNFSFDSDAAPVNGNATFDQALIGPGALSFTVPTQTPGNLANVYLGAGCGTPDAELFGNGLPTIPAPGYSLSLQTAPSTGAMVFYSFAQTSQVLAPGCTQQIDGATMGTYGFVVTGPTGRVDLPLGIPPGVLPVALNFQAATLLPGGPILSAFGLTNGLAVRIGLTGCP